MGRGNVCVTGEYEGLYYIDNDHFHVYRRDEPDSDDEFQSRLLGDLSYEELTSGEWHFDEWETSDEEDDILECFIESFTWMFRSFERPTKETWFTELDLAAAPDESFWRASCFASRWRIMSGRWPWSCSRRRTPTMTT